MIWTVTIPKQTNDPAELWSAVAGYFGHVDGGGRLAGMSTGDYGVKIHFAEEPLEDDLQDIRVMFDVPEVTCEAEA
jgi:hypothetical protein